VIDSKEEKRGREGRGVNAYNTVRCVFVVYPY
jgi:hypothetical protein